MSRLRKCKSCGAEMPNAMPLQQACSMACAISIAQKKRAKEDATIKKINRQAVRQARERLKPRSKWMAEAQAAFNRWIRARDAHLPCVSCGTMNPVQFHAGHYRTTKAAPELRFCSLNVHKQCSQCNDHLSGNIPMYRPELIRRIGLANVEWLEGPHEPAKYTIDELREIKTGFNAWAKEIEQ
jgi:hypothetical protein